jgi:hypothetical protein
MARAMWGLLVMKRRGMDLAHKPRADSNTDEHKNEHLTRFARHPGSHKRPRCEDVSSPGSSHTT